MVARGNPLLPALSDSPILLLFPLLQPRNPTSFKNEDSCEGSLKVNK